LASSARGEVGLKQLATGLKELATGLQEASMKPTVNNVLAQRPEQSENDFHQRAYQEQMWERTQQWTDEVIKETGKSGPELLLELQKSYAQGVYAHAQGDESAVVQLCESSGRGAAKQCQQTLPPPEHVDRPQSSVRQLQAPQQPTVQAPTLPDTSQLRDEMRSRVLDAKFNRLLDDSRQNGFRGDEAPEDLPEADRREKDYENFMEILGLRGKTNRPEAVKMATTLAESRRRNDSETNTSERTADVPNGHPDLVERSFDSVPISTRFGTTGLLFAALWQSFQSGNLEAWFAFCKSHGTLLYVWRNFLFCYVMTFLCYYSVRLTFLNRRKK